MRIDRRKFLACMGAVAITRVQAHSPEASGMYGLIVKLTVVPGKRDEMIGILKESAADMPGCLSYVVAQDSADENVVWVTEVWESATTHDASLSLPSVTKAMPRIKPMLSSFDKIAVTNSGLGSWPSISAVQVIGGRRRANQIDGQVTIAQAFVPPASRRRL